MRHFANAFSDVFLSLKNTLKRSIITCTLWPVTSIILKTSGLETTSMSDVLRLLKSSKLTVGRRKPRLDQGLGLEGRGCEGAQGPVLGFSAAHHLGSGVCVPASALSPSHARL